MHLRRATRLLLPAAGILCLLAAAAWVLAAAPRWRDHKPVQPLPFEHATHCDADKGNMACLACHPGAESGAAAGMPTDTHCLDCHRHILADDARLAPLHAAANADSPLYSGEPLRWRRVHALPGHVHFHHGLHAAKGVSCAECHPNPGSGKAMDMKGCLRCHRERALPTDCSACHH